MRCSRPMRPSRCASIVAPTPTSTLYEDEGDTYDYEKGEHATIPLHWDDAPTLTIGARQGSYPGMPSSRLFRIVLVRLNDTGTGSGLDAGCRTRRRLQRIGNQGNSEVMRRKVIPPLGAALFLSCWPALGQHALTPVHAARVSEIPTASRSRRAPPSLRCRSSRIGWRECTWSRTGE